MISRNQYQEVWGLIKEIPVAMMSSLDNVAVRSRPMRVVQNDFEGKLWFFTSKNAHKTKEVAAHPHVTVVFMDERKNLYVALSGPATMTQDSQLINRLWSAPTQSRFPEGRSSAQIALLEISVERAELWDTHLCKVTRTYKLAGDPIARRFFSTDPHRESA